MIIYMKPLFAFIILLSLNACSSGTPAADKHDNPLTDSLIQHLQTAPVALEEMEDVIKLNGKITAAEQQQARVYALVSGRVQSVKAELGDKVKQGQVLAVIQSPEVAGVTNELSLAEANLEMAKKNLDTRKSLYESSLVTEQEHLAAQIEYNKARSEYIKAEQVSAVTGGNTAGGYPLKAPISGSIIEKNITGHSEVRQDNDNTLFTIADLSTVWVIANVYESDIPNIHTGDPVKVTTLAAPDREYTGRIDKIYNVLDAENRTMKVRISMPNPHEELKPEMFARVYLTSRSKGGKRLCIPARAIVLDNSKRYVVVKQDGALSIRGITLIKRIGEKAFIEGLNEGEQVVTQAQVFIYDALNVRQ